MTAPSSRPRRRRPATAREHRPVPLAGAVRARRRVPRADRAHRALASFNLRNNTIPHEVIGRADGGVVMLRPAAPGTGLIAGGGVRAVLEVVGLKDVLSKSMGSNNPQAIVKATLDGLSQLRTLEQIKTLRS